jgi:3-hydroxyisobutyrate dehydrogenase
MVTFDLRMNEPLRVGFIGLGNMGAPMAGFVLGVGHSLVVHDLRRDAAAPLLDRGATWADSPAEVAAQCDVVCICVPGPSEMRAVTLDLGGVLATVRPDAAVIDHTTNAPGLVREVGAALAARGAHLLDAPLDGGREGALAGQLTLFVGGDEAVLRRVEPLLEAFSRRVVWVGGLGAGSITKIVHNALAMSIDLLLAECLTLGAKAGVAVPRLVEAFRAGCIVSENMTFTKRMPATLFRGDFTARPGLQGLSPGRRPRRAARRAHALARPVRDGVAGGVEPGLGRRGPDQASTLQEERAGVTLRL